MTFVVNPFVAILDANVFYPFRVRDVLLTFAFEGLFRARLALLHKSVEGFMS